MMEASTANSIDDIPIEAACAYKITRHQFPDGESGIFSISSRAKGIYAHYQERHQRIRARMFRPNGTSKPLLGPRGIIFGAPCTSTAIMPDCPTVSPAAPTNNRRLTIRYANSAPEISDKTDQSFSDSCNCQQSSDDDDICGPSSVDPEVADNEVAENEELLNDDLNEGNEANRVHNGPTKNLIQELLDVDRLEALVNLKGLQVRGGGYSVAETAAASGRLSRIGDEIVEQLVEWTKVLPFYNELPVEVHTQMLTQKWSELVLLSACFYATSTLHSSNIEMPSFSNSSTNVFLFQRRLSAVMNKYIPIENVVKEAGMLIQKFTMLMDAFSRLNITTEAYVCLKAIALVHGTTPELPDLGVYSSFDLPPSPVMSAYARKVQIIEDQFVKALQIHLSQCVGGPRLSELLNFLPVLTETAQILLTSKMFYVPFLICREPDQYSPPLGALAEVVAALSERGIAVQQQQQQQPAASRASLTRDSEANCTSSSISDGGNAEMC